RLAPRWGQAFWIIPAAPDVTRKAISFSPRSIRRRGGQSGDGSSSDRTAGIQYSRNMFPIGVPGPTRHKSSLSVALNMLPSPVDEDYPSKSFYRDKLRLP